MARDKMFDPAYQKAFTEAINKENQLRMNWHLKYGTLSKRSDAIDWDEDPSDVPDVSEDEDICVSRVVRPWRMPSREERAWPASTAPVSKTIPRVTQPPVVMKPVSRDVQTILYQGLSHDGEGRMQYLRHRYQCAPEDRYYFPVCSSWEYGWTYGMDTSSFLECPRHGRRQA